MLEFRVLSIGYCLKHIVDVVEREHQIYLLDFSC